MKMLTESLICLLLIVVEVKSSGVNDGKDAPGLYVNGRLLSNNSLGNATLDLATEQPLEVEDEDPCNDRLPLNATCRLSVQCEASLHCTLARCQCRPGTYQGWHDYGLGLVPVCKPYSQYGEMCEAGHCAHPLVCVKDRCACPTHTKLHLRYGICYKQCTDEEMFDVKNAVCRPIAQLDESCVINSQCSVPYSECVKNTCQCKFGFRAQVGQQCITEEFNCPFGDPIRDEMDNQLISCRRYIKSINQGIPSKSPRLNPGSSSCPPNAFCYSMPGVAQGICCPRSNPRKCPVGQEHPTAKCHTTLATEYTTTTECPSSTHQCISPSTLDWMQLQGVPICCPTPCPQAFLFSDGKCLPKVAYGSPCTESGQCMSKSKCINGVCHCPGSMIAIVTPFGTECKISCNLRQVQVEDDCVPRPKIGESCSLSAECPYGSHCSALSQKCVCNCNLVKISPYFCAPPVRCPPMGASPAVNLTMSTMQLCQAGYAEQQNVTNGLFESRLLDKCPADQFCIHYIGDPQFELGVCCPKPSNAILNAKTPVMDALAAGNACSIEASGLHVGLPEGLMGNSEVGHQNIGAGRVVYQDIVRINLTIKQNKLITNPNLVAACENAVKTSGRLHLLGLTWFNVADEIGDTSVLVRGLQPAASYVFIVRAENEHAIGEPSAMSSIVTTKGNSLQTVSGNADFDLELARTRLGAEQLVKLLQVNTINASAVQLFWKQRRTEPLIAGYYIKWQGPKRSANEQPSVGNGLSEERPGDWVNVTRANQNTAVVNRLRPFTTYTFFIQPYYRSIQGVPSNSLDGTTAESVPVVPPRDVRVRMMNLTTLRISWRPPAALGINGALKGYQILVEGNSSTQRRNISTSERAASVTLFHLLPLHKYSIRVAATTSAGVGVYHGRDTLIMDGATLQRHLRLDRAESGQRGALLSFFSNPYVIGCLVAVLWIAVMVLLFVLWYNKWCGQRAKKAHSPFIKINDGSVMARDGAPLWIDPSHAYATHRNIMLQHAQHGYTGSQTDLMYQTQQSVNQAQNGNGSGLESMLDTGPPPDYPGHPAQTSTLHRPHQYAHLMAPNNTQMSTFYQTHGGSAGDLLTSYNGHLGNHKDTASPYATTTLVMQQHERNLALQAQQRSGPPLHPPPALPQANNQHFAMYKTDSPPHTDCSYVLHSSDGNGSTGQMPYQPQIQESQPGYYTQHACSTNQRRAPRPALADFLPPPPPDAPPPNVPGSSAEASSRSAPIHRRHHPHNRHLVLAQNEHGAADSARLPAPDTDHNNYETLNDYLLRSFHSASPLQPSVNGTKGRTKRGRHPQKGALNGDAMPMQAIDADVHAQPSPSHQHTPNQMGHLYDPYDQSTVDDTRLGAESCEDEYDGQDELSQSSCSSSPQAPPSLRASQSQTRPLQPCMGVSASALTQSTYDNQNEKGLQQTQSSNNTGAAGLRSGSGSSSSHSPVQQLQQAATNQRLRTLPRHAVSGSRQDLV